MPGDTWECQGRDEHGQFGSGTRGFDSPNNVDALASIIETEARSENAAAKQAVARTVVNRMLRNHTAMVRDVWNAYAHFVAAGDESRAIACQVLAGDLKDSKASVLTGRTLEAALKACRGFWVLISSPPGTIGQHSLENTFLLRFQGYRRPFSNSIANRATVPWITIVMLSVMLVQGVRQPANASSADPFANFLNGPASLEEVYGANGAMWYHGCRTRECLAMKDIADAMTISGHRGVPSGNATLDPSKFDPRAYNRKIDALLRVHPDRMHDYCSIVEKLARHFTGESDILIGDWILELAANVDHYIDGCLRCTIRALPPIPETQKLLHSMDENCRINARWYPYACAITKAAS